jgi:hypothetical protein
MHPDVIVELEREIERLRRRYDGIRRDAWGAHEVASRWAAQAAGLCWFVPLADVVEADIDVEIAGEVLVVRANRTWPDPVVLVGILPVPRGFDLEHPVIRFTEQTLEIRVRRVRSGFAQ